MYKKRALPIKGTPAKCTLNVAKQFFTAWEKRGYINADVNPHTVNIELFGMNRIAQNGEKRNRFSKVLAEWRNFSVEAASVAI